MRRTGNSGILQLSVGRVLRFGALSCLLAVGLTACAAPNYQEPITRFSIAAQNAEAALVALDAHVTDAYFETLREEISAGERLVQVEPGECELTSDRCRLAALTTDRESQRYPPDPLLGNMVLLIQSMTDYAGGLQAIVQAETATEVATAVNATLGSVANIAASADEIENIGAARAVTAYQTPVGKALNWLVGQYVSRVKIDALEHATSEANPVIDRASRIFEEAASLAGDLARQDLVGAFDQAREKYEKSLSAADLSNFVAKAAAYDRVLTAKPSSVYSGFRMSHQALTDHLAGGDRSIADVFASINRFAAEAEALVAIVNDLAEVETE